MHMAADQAQARSHRGIAIVGLLVLPLLFVPTVAISTLGEPGFEAPAREAVTFLEAVGASSWAPFMSALQVLAAMTLLWWSVAFIRSFGRVAEERAWLPTAAIASMTVFAAYAVLASSWATAAQLEEVGPELALYAFDEGNLGFASSWLGLAGFALASGWATLAEGWLPRWQGWLAVASAVGFVAARFVWTSQLWLVPYALFWAWFVAANLVLLRRSTTASRT
ncbi:hypothetical protein [Intrasporangium sp.]|uniref:hypothetical protein n=1 Tax=Intrasporangium sp. TaxID=1925024 RepID=UPI003365964D